MARFQAQTNAILDRELETLRERLGLRTNQSADLLRELAAIASWVSQQSAAGRKIEARNGQHVEVFEHPALERLRSGSSFAAERVVLYGDERQRLAEVLERSFRATPGLRKALANLADPRRRSPVVRWKSAARRKKRR